MFSSPGLNDNWICPKYLQIPSGVTGIEFTLPIADDDSGLRNMFETKINAKHFAMDHQNTFSTKIILVRAAKDHFLIEIRISSGQLLKTRIQICKLVYLHRFNQVLIVLGVIHI